MTENWDFSSLVEVELAAAADEEERKGNLSEAIGRFKRLLAMRRGREIEGDPAVSALLGRLGGLYLQLGDLEKADEYFDQAKSGGGGSEEVTAARAGTPTEAERLKESLQKAEAAEKRPEVKAFLQRWLRDFSGKVEGAVRFVATEGQVAVQEMTDLLKPDLNWRLADLGLVALGSAPALAREQLSAQRRFSLFHCIDGEIFQDQEARFDFDRRTNSVTVEFSAIPGAGVLGVFMMVPGQNRCDRCELCQPVRDSDGAEVLRAVFTEVPDRDLTFVVHEERGGKGS